MPLVSLFASAQNPVDDLYELLPGTSLTPSLIDGVLKNDLVEADSFFALLADPPTHGDLSFHPDGSFSYLPDPKFEGRDQFTYQVATRSPKVVFTVDEDLSSVSFEVTVKTELGSSSDSATSRVGGSFKAVFGSVEPPFRAQHLTQLELSLLDEMALEFCLVRLFVCLAEVGVSADPASLSLSTGDTGLASAVNSDGEFLQVGQQISLSGLLGLNAEGQAADLLPTNTIDASEFTAETEINGSIKATNKQMTVTFPVLLEDTYPLDDTGDRLVSIKVEGQVVANGTVPDFSASLSDLATVKLAVGSGNPDSDSDGMPDDWESTHGLIVGADDSRTDLDGDGEPNISEYAADTDPGDSKDYFRINSVVGNGDNIAVSFRSKPGRSYTLQRSNNLVDWQEEPDGRVEADNNETVMEVESAGETYLRVSVAR